MRFVYTNAVQKQGEVIISGYFVAENPDETALLKEMSNSAKNGKLNEHLGANNQTIAFNHIQENLLKMNVARIVTTMKINGFHYEIGEDFRGDKTILTI